MSSICPKCERPSKKLEVYELCGKQLLLCRGCCLKARYHHIHGGKKTVPGYAPEDLLKLCKTG